MSEELSAFSTSVITPKALARVMEMLGGKLDTDFETWFIEHDGHAVEVDLASEDIEELDEELMEPLVEALGREPKSRISLLAIGPPPGEDGQIEYRMVRAIAIALAENWPIALDDHAGVVEVIQPPRGHKR